MSLSRQNIQLLETCIPLRYDYDIQKVKATILLLLDNKADVNCSYDSGFTLLMDACTIGAKEICELLIEYGAEINKIDSNNRTALSCAMENNHFDLANWLLESSKDYKASSHDVQLTIQKNQPKLLATLVSEHKADINSAYGLHVLAESIVSSFKHEKYPSLLWANDPSMEPDIMIYVLNFSLETLQAFMYLLFNAGPDINKKRNNDGTALEYVTALSQKHENAIGLPLFNSLIQFLKAWEFNKNKRELLKHTLFFGKGCDQIVYDYAIEFDNLQNKP